MKRFILMQANGEIQPMAHRDGWNYTVVNKLLMFISDEGIARIYSLDSPAIHLKTTPYEEWFDMVVSTKGGCLYFQVEDGDVKAVSETFARSLDTIDFAFIPANKLVTGEPERAVGILLRFWNLQAEWRLSMFRL